MAMSKHDEIGQKYYKPLERIEKFSNLLFWIVAALSFASLLVDREMYPQYLHFLQIMFLAFSAVYFVLGIAQRLHYFPRAEDARRRGFLSDSYGMSLTHEETVGYYNNSFKYPIRRLAASCMENSFFTLNILERMLITTRVLTAGYFLLYLLVVNSRLSEVDLITVVAQVLFSEEILSRWLRMEWLKARSEHVFYRLNQTFAYSEKAWRSGGPAQVQAIEFFSMYETSKSVAAILLSSRVFHKINPALSKEWDRIREKIGM